MMKKVGLLTMVSLVICVTATPASARCLWGCESPKTQRSMVSTTPRKVVALDPHRRGTFYLAGSGQRAAFGLGRDPAPLYTADRGRTWERIAPPEGFGTPDAFTGFTVTPDGVTAWYGRPTDEQKAERRDAPDLIAGTRTTDGGATWQSAALTCPEDRRMRL